jgi:hypothetical protein
VSAVPRGEFRNEMLKGTRNGILKRIQPVSIHGQVSWDVFFADIDDPDGQVHNARIGPEAVAGNIEPGDQIQIEYLVGVAVKITLVSAA